MIQLAPLLLALTVTAVPTKAGVSAVEIHGNQYIAKILTSPNGYEATLVLTFEDPDALLLATSVAVSATEVNPTVLQPRLPDGVFLPARFPVVVQVDQGSVAGVTFQKGYTVELITRHLSLRSYSPLRLFKAPNNGTFADVSNSIGFGSFRARGSAGSFSEFVIAADLRRDAMVIEKKFLAVKTLLDNHNNGVDILVLTYNTLDGLRSSAFSAYQDGNLPQAIGYVESMLDTVDAEAGISIEAIYEGEGDESLAGNLFGALESLRASLELLALGEPEETETLTKKLTTTAGHRLLLQVTFKGRQALDIDDFNIWAEDVDPIDPSLLARLPLGVQIPDGFPVLIHVDPGSNDEQGFRGEAQFEVITDEVDFLSDTLVRLFKAPDGGLFRDITGTYGLGSFRARGSAGSFSELILARDLRGNAAVVTFKFAALETLLSGYEGEIGAGVFSQLTAFLEAAKAAYLANDVASAKTNLDDFVSLVETQSGDGIPDIWLSTDGTLRVNVAARLLGAARSLCFNLVIERSPATDPADANRDGVVDELDVFYILSRVFPSPS